MMTDFICNCEVNKELYFTCEGGKNVAKKILTIISILFYGVMLVLTLSAVQIHKARLPQVKAEKLSYEVIQYQRVLPSGQLYDDEKKVLALPKQLYDDDRVFVIQRMEKNGLERSYAVLVKPVTGISDDTFYEVKSGIGRNDYVIVEGYENLTDRQEVNIK